MSAPAPWTEETDLQYICSRLSTELTGAQGNRIAITGGAGFLGYYLVKTLVHWNNHCELDHKFDITVYDTFLRGQPAWITEQEQNGSMKVIKRDIVLEPDSALENADFIIHAASIASPIYYREHPIETMDANVLGIRRLLDLGVRRQHSSNPLHGLLYFSTSEIYGDPDPANIPTKETYRGNVSCTGPRACYDESKRYGETLCVNFAEQHGLNVTIARPFNNYGPGLKITDGRAPPDFASDVLNNRDIVLFSDGTPTRTFCYIADAVIGYFKVLFNGTAGEAYNIGNDSPEVSVRTFAQKNVDIAKQLFHYDGKVSFARSEDEHYLTDNPIRRCPNIDKARTELGFNPAVSLDEGIQRSLLWYSQFSDYEESQCA